MRTRLPDSPLAPTPPLVTLIVDDDAALRAVAERFLVSIGHEVVGVGTGTAALAEAARRKLSCIILDLRLPDGSGLDFIAPLLEQEPYAAILMLSGVNDASAAAKCMQRGAMDYLVKPLDPPELENAIARALSHRRELIESARTREWLHRETIRQESELREERDNLENVSVAALESLVNALEAKDAYLRGHSARIADLSAMIAAELGLNDQQVELVRVAGRLHDIGKIGIREEVLAKRGPLTEEEFEHVKTHVVIGAQILAPLTHLREVIGYVRSHHEREDGTGYPDQLSAEDIPVGARIIGAAEVFDALTTSRPYQDKMTAEEAVGRMRDLTGTVISDDVHRALTAVVSRRSTLVFLDDERGKE